MTKTGRESHPRPVQIPKEGALGLLALGAVGLRLWREARDKDDVKDQVEVPEGNSIGKSKGE